MDWNLSLGVQHAGMDIGEYHIENDRLLLKICLCLIVKETIRYLMGRRCGTDSSSEGTSYKLGEGKPKK